MSRSIMRRFPPDGIRCGYAPVDDRIEPLGVKVATIEHLMAALHASGVDNARIVLNGPEVPILDGSSSPTYG